MRQYNPMIAKGLQQTAHLQGKSNITQAAQILLKASRHCSHDS